MIFFFYLRSFDLEPEKKKKRLSKSSKSSFLEQKSNKFFKLDENYTWCFEQIKKAAL